MSDQQSPLQIVFLTAAVQNMTPLQESSEAQVNGHLTQWLAGQKAAA
jgi:hypothetical protein